MKKRIPLNIEAPAPTGRDYWRSLAQMANSQEYHRYLDGEFPEGASEFGNDWSRRSFLTLMGASIALAGLSGCRRPVEKIVPYVTRPEEVIPGKPLQFVTNMPFGRDAAGVLVRSNDGRPTKIEGNPLHPSTRGAGSIFIQSEILNLYDPDRLQRPIHKGAEREWGEFVEFWRERHAGYMENKGEGLAILSEELSSPTLLRIKAEFERQFPKAVWVAWEPVSDETRRSALSRVGINARPAYDFDQADVILSLDCDFLAREGNIVENARGFAARRHVESKADDMNRLWVVESGYTVTGTMADHRYRLKSSAVRSFAARLYLLLSGDNDARMQEIAAMDGVTFDDKWIQALVKDLKQAGKKALVVTGSHQYEIVHVLVHKINALLGSVGTTVKYRPDSGHVVSDSKGLADLTARINSGAVETLIVFGGNPVYSAPADIGFRRALSKVTNGIHFTDRADETARECAWNLPRSHFLESWGDVKSEDGTLGIIQPLIEPLFESRNDVEVLALITSGLEAKAYDLVRDTWKKYLSGDFETQWRRLLHDGLLSDSAGKAALRFPARIEIKADMNAGPESVGADTLEVNFRTSNVYDGRLANNGWLQELPDAVTKLAWDNAALISHTTAQKYGVQNEDMIRIDLNGRSIDMVAWIQPGHADDSLTLYLGYGRTHAGRVGDGVGVDVNPLRTSEHPYIATGATITKLNRKYSLANTQDHGSMEGRPIVREASLSEYKKSDNPTFTPEPPHHPPLASLWDEHTYEEGYQWGMVVDLNKCIGCNACTVACQSENNIPIVGKEQVRTGREMHWIRLDRYFAGDAKDPETVFQPVACQHCEMAPCETVCPVAATVHDDEGLNLMVYNRCIGTRYCSNNCPYKVRRFNFFNYTSEFPELHKMSQNPEVTVRSRGVMEKCTYCLQRISGAKIAARAEGRTVGDDDLQTACQQVCPSKAITFGNVNSPDSAVSKAKKINRNYSLLEELNTRPRTSFLARLRNPHPDLEEKPTPTDKKSHGDSGH
jgi:molybdopterin-containing oxidoreductase family iron-sulfur binding subunit